MRSRKGTSRARPGSRIRSNLPIRSTIHAVCWGTNRTTVFAGRVGRLLKYVGVPPDCWGTAANPLKSDSGARLRGEFDTVRDCVVLMQVLGRRWLRCWRRARDLISLDDWRDSPSIFAGGSWGVGRLTGWGRWGGQREELWLSDNPRCCWSKCSCLRR